MIVLPRLVAHPGPFKQTLPTLHLHPFRADAQALRNSYPSRACIFVSIRPNSCINIATSLSLPRNAVHLETQARDGSMCKRACCAVHCLYHVSYATR
jgi:hypothetical protein